MRKNILALSFVLLALLGLCSCGDDNETVLSSDCYISSFLLGTVQRTAVTTSSTGEDSTYIATYNASAYYMTIDQLKGTIENKDSLPVNSLSKAMLVSIETTGVLVYRPEGGGDDSWKAYSSTDSIDFTRPVVFRVISADGMYSRDYTAKVNVHQQDGDEFVWTRLSEPGLWTAADRLKLLVWKDKAWMFTQRGDAVTVFCADAASGTDWQEQVADGCAGADVKTLIVWGEKLYMSRADGSLLVSGDALHWTDVPADRTGLRLLAADGSGLYAVSGLSLWRSVDGERWTEETLDEVPDSLPVRDYAAVSYTQTDGLQRLLLVGNRSLEDYSGDTHAMVWGRGTRGNAEDASWMYYEWSADNLYACPRLSPLELVHCGDLLIACGGASIGGTVVEPLENMYVSRDNGLTWKADAIYVIPESVRKSQAPFAVAADDNNYLWLAADGEIWRSRLNKYGF